MPKVRKEIPELEKLVQVGRKKFVRYEEGAQLYSMGLHTFQKLAKLTETLETIGLLTPECDKLPTKEELKAEIETQKAMFYLQQQESEDNETE